MATEIYGKRSHRDSILVRDSNEIRFFDSDSSNYSGFAAPASLTGDVTFTLPDGDGNSGEALSTNGSGVLSWSSYLASLLNSQNVFVGNVSNAATATDTTSTGDILANSTTALTIKTGVISNVHINASAAIALTKLAALTNHDRALVSDGSGFVAESAVTSTELGYVSGVTSAIQTQLGGKASTALSNLAAVAINTTLVSDTDNTDDLGTAAIGWANGYINKLILDSNSQSTTIQGSASASASVTYSLPPADGSSGFVLSTNGSGVTSWVSNSSVSSFKADWVTADGASTTVVHNLGSSDVMVQIYDADDGSSIEVDSIVRTDSNTLDLVASQAPATSWRVLIVAV